MGDKTKIDWADATWNPVTGCWHECGYCYARRIAERFTYEGQALDAPCELQRVWIQDAAGLEPGLYVLRYEVRLQDNGRVCPYPFGFAPTFHKYRLDIPKRWTKPRTIFVCSMADLFGEWVPDKWIKEVFDACRKAPQHRYLFLTKNPQRYIDLRNQGVLPRWNEAHNMWFGSTTTKKQDKVFGDSLAYNTFMSIEPILEPFDNLGDRACIVDWIIVGAETGNRKWKITPEKGWITEIAEGCRRTNTPIFMKESLREIMGPDFVQEFPWVDEKEANH